MFGLFLPLDIVNNAVKNMFLFVFVREAVLGFFQGSSMKSSVGSW